MIGEPQRIMLVAGEHSGDRLGAALISVLDERLGGRVKFSGVGGPLMAKRGVVSLFPIEEIALMGIGPVLKRLPMLVQRMRELTWAIVEQAPDILIIIDSPEFTHHLARRVRRLRPSIPILNYVSPSVWAWRSGRAAKMRHYIDHVLAILPFEPAVYQDLHGPPCSYVGHPLAAHIGEQNLERRELRQLVILPGSRDSEIERLMRPFGDVVREITDLKPDTEVIIPSLASKHQLIAQHMAAWARPAEIVVGEQAKWDCFATGGTALAASGTVSLELAISGMPTVVAYKVESLVWRLRFLSRAPSIVLPNLILQRNAIPEFLQERAEADYLVPAVTALMEDGPPRHAQLAALAELKQRMDPGDSASPAQRAAEIVMGYIGRGHREAR